MAITGPCCESTMLPAETIRDLVVTDALDIDNLVSFCNDSRIISNDATIGSSINEGTVVSSAVLANIVCDVGKFGLTLLR